MPLGIQQEHTKDPFDDFLDTIKEPREVIQESYMVDEPEPEEIPEYENPTQDDTTEYDPTLEKNKLEIAMIPAETIVDVIDTTAISVNSYIAQQEMEGASSQEKQSLQKAIANYLRETDVEISPSKMCILLILMIYGPKTLQAFQMRKINMENRELKSRVKYLENKLNEKKDYEIPNM